jgi:predicted alpha/beta hydrolase family esterase
LKWLIKEIVKEVLSKEDKNDKTIIIVHGWSGSPEDNWIPYTKSSLKKLGYNVICPTMPHSDNPTIKDWIPFLSNIVGEPNKNTYFIGHSIGCQTIMRYLETIDTKVGGVVFVAGFFDLKNLGDEEKKIAKQWIETPIDIEKVKNNIGFSIVFLSNDDTDVPYQKTKEKFEKLFGSTIITVDDAGHFTTDDGYDSFPKLVSVIDKKISNKKIVNEVLSGQDKNAKTEHFWVKFGEPDIVKGAGKIFLGNEWFANAVQMAADWNPKYAGKWVVNRHTGAFRLKLPPSKGGYYSTIQELLNDLETWYIKNHLNK